MSTDMDTQMSHGPSFARPKLSLGLQETTTSSDFSMIPTTSTNSATSDVDMIAHLQTTIDLNASYEVTASGTLRTKGFQVNAGGIVAQPPISVSQQSLQVQQEHHQRRLSGQGGGGGMLSPIFAAASSSSSNSASVRSPSPLSPGAEGELTSTPQFSLRDLTELGSVGKGACGIVKRALHLPTMQLLALKQINIFDKEKRHQFVKELRALNSLASPYIVGFYGATYSEGSITLLLEYANRHSLLEVLKLHGAFSEIMLRRIGLHTFRGLELLHASRVIHRDIKPGNILINSGVECKLTDFGVVTALEGTMDLATTFVGTSIYMSPERISNEGKYSYPSDVWSLGVSLWYLAVNELPYNGSGGYWGIVKSIRDEPVPELPQVNKLTNQPYSACFRDFLSKCLIKDPAQRWTATQLLQHPFLNEAESAWAQELARTQQAGQLIHPIMTVTESDRTDLDAILLALYKSHYDITSTTQKGNDYRKSLMDLARFQKLEENLCNSHITATMIQTRFEEIYKQMRAQTAK